MKKFIKLTFIVVSCLFVLAACSKSIDPKSYLTEALTKSVEMKSYAFEGEMNLKMDLPDSAGPEAAMLLQDILVTFEGVTDADKTELTLELAVKGDAEFKLNVPMIMNKEKVWIKVPQIPFAPLPEEYVGKFIELDLAELTQGQELDAEAEARIQELATDTLTTTIKHLKEEEFFSTVNKKDAEIPSNVDVDQAVKVSITNKNFETVIDTLVTKVAPEIIDLIEEKYKSDLSLDSADLEEARKELEKYNKDDLKKINEHVDINKFDIVFAVDKNKFVTYQNFNTVLKIKVDGEEAKINLKAAYSVTDINKKQEFKLEIPKDPVTMEEFFAGMWGVPAYDDWDDEDLGLDNFDLEDLFSPEELEELMEALNLEKKDLENMTFEELLKALEAIDL